jgi:hypothetical protein
MNLGHLSRNCLLLLCCITAFSYHLFPSSLAGGLELKHIETSGSAEAVCKFAEANLRFEIAGDPFDLLESSKHFKLLETGELSSVYVLSPPNTQFLAIVSVHLPKAPNSQLLIVDRNKRPGVSITDAASFDKAAVSIWQDDEGVVLFGAYYVAEKRKRFDASRDAASQRWRSKSRSLLGHFFLKFEYDNRTYFIDRSVGYETAYVFSLNQDLAPQGHCFFQAR